MAENPRTQGRSNCSCHRYCYRSALDKGKGAVATLLVQQGTLNVQDPIVVGNTFGRVRAMTNDLGRRVKVAGPSTPVSITGLNEAPMAGDHFCCLRR